MRDSSLQTYIKKINLIAIQRDESSFKRTSGSRGPSRRGGSCPKMGDHKEPWRRQQWRTGFLTGRVATECSQYGLIFKIAPIYAIFVHF